MGTVRTGFSTVERAAYEALLIDYACQHRGYSEDTIKWLKFRIGPLGDGPLVEIQKRKRVEALRLMEADLTFRDS